MKWLLLFPLLLTSSCSHTDPEEEKPPENQEKKPVVVNKRIVGRVASVSSTGTFVLIQKYGTGSLPKNEIIQSQGSGGRQATLVPSGERVRDFFAADLVSGSAKIGDAVVAYKDLKTPEATPSPTVDEDAEPIPPDEMEAEADEAPKPQEKTDAPNGKVEI